MERVKNRISESLKWGEAYLKTDLVYLTKGSFWLSLSQIVVSLGSLLLAIAFAHFVSKEIYGQYKYILSLVSVLGTLTLSNIGLVITRSTAQGKEGVLKQAFWFNLRWSIVYIIVCLGMALYYLFHNNLILGFSLIIVAVCSPLLNSFVFYSPFLIGKKDFRRNSIFFDILGNLFPLACLLLTMSLKGGVIALVFVYFFSNTLIAGIFYWLTLKIYKPNEQKDPDLRNYGLNLSLMGILNSLANNIDQILLFHYIGAAGLAIYNFAIAIPNQIKGPLKGLDNLIMPNYANRTPNEIKQTMNKKIFYIFLVLSGLVIIYILTAQLIFTYLFPQYIGSVLYSQIFVLSILGFTFWPTTTYLAAHRKIREQYISNLSTSIVQVALVVIGAIYAGLWGVIIARVITRITWGLINYLVYLSSSKQ